MNSVEAAASLFGPEEPASDPFAALGADSTPQPSTDDLFSGHDTPATSEFLTPASGYSTLLGSEGNSPSEAAQYNTWGEPPTNQYGHNPDPYSQDLSTGGSSYDQAQGWYDEHGQWQTYEQPVSEPISTAQEPLASQKQSIPSGAYDPYAPQSSYAAPSYPDTQHSTQTQSPYDPYIPATQSSRSYIPPSVPASQPAYNPYTPSAPASAFQPPASQFTSPYSSANQPSYTHSASSSAPTVPPPPAPTAVLNRPKVSNAYDPPFPTTKSHRRGASRAGLSASATVGQQAYAAYNSYNAPLSPPMAGGSHTSPAYSQGPPAASSHSNPEPLAAYGSSDVTYGSEWSQPTINSAVPHDYAVAYGDNSEASHPQGLPPQNDYPPWSPPEASPSVDIMAEDPTPHQATISTYLSGHVEPEIPPHSHEIPSEAQLPENGFPFPDSNLEDNHHAASPLDNSYKPYSIAASSPKVLDLAPHSRSSSPRSTGSHHSALTSPPPASYGSSGSSIESRLTNAKRSSPSGSFTSHSRNGSYDTGPPKNNTQTSKLYGPQAVERTSSPASIHSLNGPQGSPNLHETVANPYLPKSVIGGERVPSPGSASRPPLNGTQHTSYIPKSKNEYGVERASSPGSFSVRSNGSHSANQYAPPKQGPGRPPELRNRSLSNGSVLSTASGSPEDLYAPSHRTDYGAYSSRYDYPNSNETTPYGFVPVQAYDLGGGQEVLSKPTHAPYAPSPSLMGANDPLGRTAARVPVFSFGFGGKLVTCFHGASSLNTGFDVALSSRNSTGIHIRTLNKLIPESALDTSTASFPGPLFSDPGTPTTSLVRTGATAHTKTKKTRVVKYLVERAEEIARGIGYLNPGSAEGRQAEGKLVLVNLLRVMVENDGRLSGTPQIDTAVRSALVPRLSGSAGTSADPSTTIPGLGFSSLGDVHGPVSDLPSASYTGLTRSPPNPNETPIAITSLRASALDKIQEFLLRGERRQAYHYALDENLWAHAMVIASSIDKEAWKEVVNEFLKSDLGVKDDTARGPTYLRGADAVSSAVNGREGLRVAYSLFSGQGAAAVQELVPQNLLSRAARLPLPTISHMTPMTPNFAATTPMNIPVETLSRWAETVAMMFSSPLPAETSAALTALGDQLSANKWTEAAHVCYLLAPQTSPMGGVGNPSARIVLLGSRSPHMWPTFSKDPDSIIFSEIVEFALSLATPVKGQDAFVGLAHLQPYRLLRAMSLAEIGDIQLANRYCDAINASLSRSSPYFTGVFLDQLKGLTDRIVAAPHIDKSGSWIGGKLSKPSLDTIGGWLEGRFTKLVTGDSDAATPPEEVDSKPAARAFIGPFSHYSTISSATPSASPSPQPTAINHNVLPPPQRTGSAMAGSASNPHAQIDRASSAMDYVRRKPSPVPRIASAGATTTSFAQSPSFGQALNDYSSSMNGFSPDQDTPTPRPSHDTIDESTVQEVSWWGSSSYGENSTTQTPTVTNFLRVEETAIAASSDGFISLMDDASYTVTPQPTIKPQSHQSSGHEEDEDLGFGNSKRDKSADDETPKSSPGSSEPAKPAKPERPELKPATTGSWISRWWKKSESAPGPIRASLGDETTFYYDKELKRWVNKKAGDDGISKPSVPPPPPSRSQTASPGRTGPNLPTGTSAGPPPARAASAIDLSTSPPSKTVMRVRSNLVPAAGTESAPSTPTGSRLGPTGPPPGRPKSQASKRNIRNRYVDVFQAEGGGV